jgi:hypothetical protein
VLIFVSIGGLVTGKPNLCVVGLGDPGLDTEGCLIMCWNGARCETIEYQESELQRNVVGFGGGERYGVCRQYSQEDKSQISIVQQLRA